MTIGSAIDAFINALSKDPGLWVIGAFTLIGFLFVVSISSIFMWYIIKRIWCFYRKHSFYVEAVCRRCGQTEFLAEQYELSTDGKDGEDNKNVL